MFVLDFRGTIVCTRFQGEQLFVLDFRGNICFLIYNTELQIVFVYVCMLPIAGQTELTVEKLPKIQILDVVFCRVLDVFSKFKRQHRELQLF